MATASALTVDMGPVNAAVVELKRLLEVAPDEVSDAVARAIERWDTDDVTDVDQESATGLYLVAKPGLKVLAAIDILRASCD